MIMYYWKITRDRVHDETSGEPTDKGIDGPSGCDDSLRSNPAKFSLYDDDDTCYYEGVLYGDYEGFEPLDDFGMGWAGCTYIKIDGEIL